MAKKYRAPQPVQNEPELELEQAPPLSDDPAAPEALPLPANKYVDVGSTVAVMFGELPVGARFTLDGVSYIKCVDNTGVAFAICNGVAGKCKMAQTAIVCVTR